MYRVPFTLTFVAAGHSSERRLPAATEGAEGTNAGHPSELPRRDRAEET